MSAVVTLKRGDTRTAIRATLLSPNGNPVDLTGTTVKFIMADLRGGIKINRAAQVQDAVNGKVLIAFEPSEVDTAGTYHSEFEVIFGDGRIETYPNSDYLTIEIKPDLG